MTGYRNALAILLVALLWVIPVSAADVYNTAGTFSWNSTTNTMVFINATGGGGSGHGGWVSIGTEYAGHGGNAGTLISISGITVTPNTLYTIVVGAGGDRDNGGDGSNVLAQAGAASTAFGQTAAGGTAVYGTTAGGNGEAGANGHIEFVNTAENGEDVTTYTGGAGGEGYGAGGGGGAANGGTDEMGYGGAGLNGAVWIYPQWESIGNYPNFTASQTAGGAGMNVLFTNSSIIHDTANLSWLWDFGDGSTSTTVGSVSHIYAYYGTYTVSLTLTSDTGAPVLARNEYILISPQESSLDLKTEPKAVQFHVQTLFGSPLTDANVSIQGITTSTGDWDWIPLLLGIPLDEVALNNTAMYQTTDTLGNVEFLMIPSAKYNVTTTLAGYQFTAFYVVPHDERYTIIANVNGSSWFESGNNTLAQVNVTVNSVKLDSTTGQINVTYEDTGLQTTGGNIYIYKMNATKGGADVLVETIPITSNSFTNSTNVTLSDTIGGDDSFKTSVEPVRTGDSIGDPTVRSFTVWFKGKNVEITGFDPTVLLWLSLFIIIFTAMFAGATHAPQIAIMICVEAWIFYAMGWLDPLSNLPLLVNEGGLMIVLSVATFMAVVWNFREGKRREKGT